MEKLIKLLKKIGKVLRYPHKPRSKGNRVWEQFEKKKAHDYYKKGLYTLEEYREKIKEINRKVCEK